jgi:phosphoribosylformylglycinamidine synthase
VRRAVIMALVVGPILTLINQGDALIGEVAFSGWKAALTFVVPYVVATVSAVATERGKAENSVPCKPQTPSLVSGRPDQGGPESGGARVKARVHVTLKTGVLDPQGKAIANALDALGFAGVGEVRQGKVIDLEIAGSDRDKARDSVEAMCRKLLANTVIEDYAIELEG